MLLTRKKTTSMENLEITININDLYSFLITYGRYAYTRNNHLEPSCFYYAAKNYLVKMLKVYSNLALHTAKQLCEECISYELATHFYDGFDDEWGNRNETLTFIDYLITWIHNNGDANYKAYNFDLYTSNLKKDDECIYNIYEVEYESPNYNDEYSYSIPELKNKINDLPLSRKEYPDALLKYLNIEGNILFNKIRIKDKNSFNMHQPETFKYRFDDLKRSFIVIAEVTKKDQ